MRGLGANRTDDQRHQHSRLQSFAGHVSHDDQHAAIVRMWNDLEEVSTHFPRRTIFALNRQSRNSRQFFRNQHLLHLLRLLHVLLHRLLPPLRTAEVPQQNH